ncbi:site-2 protease family protein [Saccharopolyspora thermophila]|uniref:Zinc metalloprotease n=1 Tax=Saccharopolyspora thermophila TaxID=89367 RepID=A0ABP3ME90_9PSEU
MNGAVPVGRVAGVRVELHWSVLGIVVLVAAGLAAYQLPRALPGHSALGYAVSGTATAVLLVGSLLAHETAHAVVARRNGVAVEGITLWLLGGLARLRGEARSPGAELRIAVVGPVTSAALAVIFGLLALGVARFGGALAVAVLSYLAVLNAVLAVFNLVPAAPLDGGRVLRAALWRWRGNRFQAAVWSARAGLGLGYLLIAAGFVQLVAQGAEGLWWAVLGLFITSTAVAEERQARAGLALRDVRVRDVMSHPVETADGARTAEQFLRELRTEHAAYPVRGVDGSVDGLVSLRRLRSLTAAERERTTLREAACPVDQVPAAEPDEPLADVLPRLGGFAEGRVLVFTAGRLCGIVSPSDISRSLAEHGASFVPRVRDDPRPPPPDWWYPGQPRPG